MEYIRDNGNTQNSTVEEVEEYFASFAWAFKEQGKLVEERKNGKDNKMELAIDILFIFIVFPSFKLSLKIFINKKTLQS